MLTSGNGRHRRPRQAPTAVITVAATGAGLALPLFGATGAAQAADSSTVWNAVAQCESGGTWSADTGNGFYGGLQITQETWADYGGTQFAERPDLASMSEQISIAEKILVSLGPDAWPGCEDGDGLSDLLTQLTATGSSSDTATPTPTASTADGTTASGHDGDGDGSATAASPAPTDTATGDGTGTAASPAPTDPATGAPAPSATGGSTGGGRHAKPSTGSGTSDTGTGTGSGTAATPAGPQAAVAWGQLTPDTALRNQARVELAPASATSASPATTPSLTASATTYRVHAGDTLSSIASAEHVAGGWRALYETNRQLIGDDPSVIHVGESLALG